MMSTKKPVPQQESFQNIWFIDIDGTLTDATRREQFAYHSGVVEGSYGSKRSFPKGKEVFEATFHNPMLLTNDTTMPFASSMMRMLEYDDNQVIFLTARKIWMGEATKEDLVTRNLWKKSSQLICKPTHYPWDSSRFKAEMIFATSLRNPHCSLIFVDNCKKNREVAKKMNPKLKIYSSCKEALVGRES